MKRKDESERQRIKRENKELKELMNDSKFEKGDLSALIIAALTSILPFAIVIFVLLFFIPMLIFNLF